MEKFVLALLFLIVISCGQPLEGPTEDSIEIISSAAYDYTVVFASCNDQDRDQPLWDPILKNAPDLFIWGGDNIYADTDDMNKMQSDYNKVWAQPGYVSLSENTIITGTWDDHDYGKNDAGADWKKKAAAKELLLEFLKVPEDDVRRTREGVYTAENYTTNAGSIKVILLDTRTFRDSLKKSDDPNRRYDAWAEGEGGTILGETQWKWLEEELEDDTANFTIIVSSNQLLSDRHGWEKWANHPSEVIKMKELIANANARNIIILSGDRHMGEISIETLPGMNYPLVDFTSSGLTHTWIDSATESNPYRVSNVIKKLNFGVLQFDFEENRVRFELRGRENFLFDMHEQDY